MPIVRFFVPIMIFFLKSFSLLVKMHSEMIKDFAVCIDTALCIVSLGIVVC